jgi:hypothetical protein
MTNIAFLYEGIIATVILVVAYSIRRRGPSSRYIGWLLAATSILVTSNVLHWCATEYHKAGPLQIASVGKEVGMLVMGAAGILAMNAGVRMLSRRERLRH